MGPVGRALGVGQAAARQRPASRPRLSRHLVSRAPGRAGLRHPRRHLARLAGRSCSATTAPIGWGFTTTNLDSQDLFIERIDPTDPSRYITPDGARPFGVRDETINVLWGDPVHLRVRSTRHGVVIDDFVAQARRILAGRPRAGPAGDRARRRRHLARGLACASAMAQNWDDFLAAARQDRHARCRTSSMPTPAATSAWCRRRACRSGARATARCPRRAGPANTTGRASCRSTNCRASTIRRAASSSTPTPGWCPTTTAISSPATGRAPYRQRRANQLLREVERHPVYGMIAIQADNLSPDAADMLPLLLKPAAAQPARRAGATT